MTHYTVIERFARITYISVVLETGRTHQIRVHFAHRRHALVGDQAYGGDWPCRRAPSDQCHDAERLSVARHCTRRKLEFEHPISGEAMRARSEPPDDFQAVLDVCAKDASNE